LKSIKKKMARIFLQNTRGFRKIAEKKVKKEKLRKI